MISLLLLLSCSDYKLSGGNDNPPGGDGGRPDGGAAEDGGGGDSGWLPPTEETGDGGGETLKIDVLVIVDVAYSYDCYHPDVDLRVRQLAEELWATGHDVAMAVATYDDYAMSGKWWARTGGKPYTLVQQMTTNKARVESTAAGLAMEWGGDGPGSAYEAIVQGLKGQGYDQDCSGSYDSTYDVKPYEATSRDAFGGRVTGVRDSGVPGTGDKAGVGFRDGAQRVVILHVDNSIRDRSYGDDLPTGACLGVASASDAASAITGADAHFIGINAYEFQDEDGTPQAQLRALAASVGALWDADGDGIKSDLAVQSGSWDWPEAHQTVEIILQMVGG